jgi:hypothetical protein
VFADHGQRVQDALCPSTVDLELSAEFELASPGRVDGIIVPVPKRAIASLLLYRRGDHPLVPYYETVEKVPTFPRVVDFLKQCGLVAASVDFDLRKKEYLNGWRDQITSLSFGGEQ